MATENRHYQMEGALATLELVGRDDLVERYEKFLGRTTGQPRVIFYWAKGGMGKTRLLNKMLRLAGKTKDAQVAENLVDFYHVNNHTPNGLAETLYKMLRQSGEFKEYLQKRDELEFRLATGNIDKATSDQRAEALEAFNIGIRAITSKSPLVIALDTAEKALYGLFDGKLETADGWKWFCNSLPHWGNVTILLAGREESKSLLADIEKSILPENVEVVEVVPFSESQSLQYFDKVREVLGKEIAEKIEKLPENTRKLAHIYSGGLPILLALLVENLSADRRIPRVLTSEDANKKSSEEIKEISENFKKELIEDLMAADRIGETVLALGRAPKGVDETLLSLLLVVPVEDARARLEEVKGLSFVKTFPLDDRFFLHDEMYAILNQQVYSKSQDAVKKEKAEHAILTYYHDHRIQKNREAMNALFDPIEKGQTNTLSVAKKLIEINNERIVALTDLVYYRLRQNPVEGYKRFYRYTREATLSRNMLFELHLQSELASFLTEWNTQGRSEEIAEAGISQDMLDWSVLIRSVTMAWGSMQYEKVLEAAAKIREDHADTLKKTSPGSDAMLSAWEAYALIFQQQFDPARTKLDYAIRIIEEEIKNASISEIVKWRLNAVLGFAHRVRGYLFRVKGGMKDAIDDYRRAAALFKKVNLLIELAMTLNDMGFAMSEQGNSHDARAIVEEALRIRRYLGPRFPIGLSYSTLAMLDNMEGHYPDAIKHATYALSIFRALDNSRGLGLAYIGLSEAQRRHSGSLTDPEEKIRWLRDARDSAESARNIFRNLGEQYSQADALIEEGCAGRDWVKARLSAPSGRDNVRQLSQESEKALREAAKIVGNQVLHRQIDALLDLAWLRYYTNEDELMEKIIKEVEEIIPGDYLLDKTTGKPQISHEAAYVRIWSEIGKLYILRGDYFFRKYFEDNENGKKEKDRKGRLKSGAELERATENYCLGLQYSSIFSPAYHALDKAKNQIYGKLKNLENEELTIVTNVVEKINSEYNLNHNVMKEFLTYRALWNGD